MVTNRKEDRRFDMKMRLIPAGEGERKTITQSEFFSSLIQRKASSRRPQVAELEYSRYERSVKLTQKFLAEFHLATQSRVHHCGLGDRWPSIAEHSK